MKGHLDAATCRRIAGWALDPSDIESPLEVEVLIGGRKRGSVVADGYRHDLELAGKGQGRCAFEWAAHELHDSIGQLVTLRVNGFDTAITGSGRSNAFVSARASVPREFPERVVPEGTKVTARVLGPCSSITASVVLTVTNSLSP